MGDALAGSDAGLDHGSVSVRRYRRNPRKSASLGVDDIAVTVAFAPANARRVSGPKPVVAIILSFTPARLHWSLRKDTFSHE